MKKQLVLYRGESSLPWGYLWARDGARRARLNRKDLATALFLAPQDVPLRVIRSVEHAMTRALLVSGYSVLVDDPSAEGEPFWSGLAGKVLGTEFLVLPADSAAPPA